MNEFAEVSGTCHFVTLPDGGARYFTSYEWRGSQRAKVWLDPEDALRVPYPLKEIDFDWARGQGVYVRTDVHFWWLTWLFVAIQNRLQWINLRLMLTAHIWGIVWMRTGDMPSWRAAFLERWKRG